MTKTRLSSIHIHVRCNWLYRRVTRTCHRSAVGCGDEYVTVWSESVSTASIVNLVSWFIWRYFHLQRGWWQLKHFQFSIQISLGFWNYNFIYKGWSDCICAWLLLPFVVIFACLLIRFHTLSYCSLNSLYKTTVYFLESMASSRSWFQRLYIPIVSCT